MSGGLASRCVGRVYGADGDVHGTIRTVHTTNTSWHFTLFHEEDARSNNPQVTLMFKTVYVTDELLVINIFSFHDGESKNYCF